METGISLIQFRSLLSKFSSGAQPSERPCGKGNAEREREKVLPLASFFPSHSVWGPSNPRIYSKGEFSDREQRFGNGCDVSIGFRFFSS